MVFSPNLLKHPDYNNTYRDILTLPAELGGVIIPSPDERDVDYYKSYRVLDLLWNRCFERGMLASE